MRPSKSIRRRRLRIEALESRRLLATFAVVNSNDSGEGSLRWAIAQSNATAGHDTISFALPSESRSIVPVTALPWLTDGATLDATTQPGYAGVPLVELNGENLDGNYSGLVLNADNVQVRGFAINRFPASGVFVERASHGLIENNYIGTDLTGLEARPNAVSGIEVLFGSHNQIGSPGKGNLISGNTFLGVRFWGQSSQYNKVQGNLIGTDATGTKALGNRDGVDLSNSANLNLIGTDGDNLNDAAERNIISGNSVDGIRIEQSFQNTIAGNYLGTNVHGDAAVPNGFSGVWISNQSNDNMVGGDSPAERNIISGNDHQGISVSESRANSIQGNYIGLDATGTKKIGNRFNGLWLTNVKHTDIGGYSAATRNVISGNNHAGVLLRGGGKENSLRGNWIGVAADGTTPLGNGIGGIRVTASESARIGSSDGVHANTIAYNGQYGVRVESGAQQVQIAGNRIFGNAVIGIDLGQDLSTPNDPMDLDSGPNGLQNHPEILMAARNDTDSVVLMTLQSSPNQRFTSEIYEDDSNTPHPDATILASYGVSLRTDAQGQAITIVQIPDEVSKPTSLTSTATFSGATSEFSPSVPVVELLNLYIQNRSPISEGDTFQAILHRGDWPLDQPLTANLSSTIPSQLLMPSQVVIPANSESVEFSVEAVDDAIHQARRDIAIVTWEENRAAGGAVLISVNDNDQVWHNNTLALDVNNDGIIAPNDVLAIINLLNSGTTGILDALGPFDPVKYADTSDDGYLAPNDALRVINHLNSSANSEGESTTGEDDGAEIWDTALLEQLAASSLNDLLSDREDARAWLDY